MRSLLLLAVLSLPLAAQSPKQPQHLAITHATLLDVRTGQLHPDTTVLLTGNRITTVAQHAPAPVNTQVIDAHGRFLLPGLWDMHTHVFFDRTANDGSDLILPEFLAFGITGIRDMGSALDAVLHARDSIAAHTLLGPRMVVAGPMLDGPHTTYQAAIPITTPASGRAAVDMLHTRGVNFIKVQSGIPRDAYFAIADQAHHDHIEFEGHVPDSIRTSEAIHAGQRTMEHLIGIFEASSPAEDGYLHGSFGDQAHTKTPAKLLAAYDPAREKRIIALIAANNVYQCPTLFWERGQWLVDAVDYTKDPDLAFAAHSWVTTLWPSMQKGIAASLDTDPLPLREHFVQHELGIVHRLQLAGVPFLAGTDTPAGVDVIPGASLHHELERLVAAGFTPLAALQTATLKPAIFLHRENDLGAVAPGHLADLILLDQNPLTDIRNTRSVSAVFHDGQYLSTEDLAHLRTHLKSLAATR